MFITDSTEFFRKKFNEMKVPGMFIQIKKARTNFLAGLYACGTIITKILTRNHIV